MGQQMVGRNIIISYYTLNSPKSNIYLLYSPCIADNVHFQHSAQLMKALIDANVDYRMQVYSDKNHFLSGADRHLYRTITKFLKNDCWSGGEPREVKPGEDEMEAS